MATLVAVDETWQEGKLLNILGHEDYLKSVLVMQVGVGKVVRLVVDREELERYARNHISATNPEDFIGENFWYSLEDDWILSHRTMPHYGLKKVVTKQELGVE